MVLERELWLFSLSEPEDGLGEDGTLEVLGPVRFEGLARPGLSVSEDNSLSIQASHCLYLDIVRRWRVAEGRGVAGGRDDGTRRTTLLQIRR